MGGANDNNGIDLSNGRANNDDNNKPAISRKITVLSYDTDYKQQQQDNDKN